MHHKDRKSNHMKQTTYKTTTDISRTIPHDQLHKHTKTDPLENILTQLEKQPAANNITITYAMDNMGTKPHMNIQQCMKNRTIMKKDVRKIMNRKYV